MAAKLEGLDLARDRVIGAVVSSKVLSPPPDGVLSDYDQKVLVAAKVAAQRMVWQDPWKASLRAGSAGLSLATALLLVPEVQAELLKLLPMWVSKEYLPLATALLAGGLSLLSKLRDPRPVA